MSTAIIVCNNLPGCQIDPMIAIGKTTLAEEGQEAGNLGFGLFFGQ